ncbi:MAG: hypothetical protein HKO66_10430 [Saprospiraceae bacterium]|nr:XdhC family protein [Bacteroidia bacterium]NNL92639.1 hypothetical protein [Saprospiraceae bacterium]
MSNALKNEIDNQILNVIFNENKALFSAVDKLGHKKTFFIESFKPQRKVMIVSRDLNPMELISFSKTMGWETTLISSVKTNYNNVNKFSFKDLSRLHLNIDENTAIIIYNNDIKDDIYCLSRFLKFNSGYIGVLRTLKQAQKIREEIFKKYNNLYSSLSKVHMPMGLNLFSQSISEIALAVMSEVLAVFNGSTLGNNEYRPQINMIKMSSAIVLDAKNP